MKKKWLNALEEMLGDPHVYGKSQIRAVIWMNTVKPKYKVGDYVVFDDRGHQIYGNEVRGFNGKIKAVNRVTSFGSRFIQYEIDIDVVCGDKRMVTNCFVHEEKIHGRTKKNVNYLERKSGTEDCIVLNLAK